ncbi:UBP-type zinc finger domain-containing protein [Streptomyces sp. NPDC058394]|uniref:UBP-type zinc finger domain-containing protein n=1 Tax=Streptomyces sp. NPDC058394 TaxID=3346477 RepID=UPI0036608152
MTTNIGIDPPVLPSGTGCVECEATNAWWFHLRRCALCGHVGCCDSSVGQHATAHYKRTGHPVVQSFEPGEEWFWDYAADDVREVGPRLAAPGSHPENQPVPGPVGRVPANWMRLLHR